MSPGNVEGILQKILLTCLLIGWYQRSAVGHCNCCFDGKSTSVFTMDWICGLLGWKKMTGVETERGQGLNLKVMLIPLLVLLRSPINPVRSLLQHSLPTSPVPNLQLDSSPTSPVLLPNLQASPAAPLCWMMAHLRTPLRWKWQKSQVESSSPCHFSLNLCRPRQSGLMVMTTAMPTPTRTATTTTNAPLPLPCYKYYHYCY